MYASQVLDDITAAVGRLDELDPASLLGAEAEQALVSLLVIERSVAAKRLALTGRIAETGVWRAHGHRSPAAAVSSLTGTSRGEARRMLRTAEALRAEPVLGEALATGSVSESQAAVLAPAVLAAPDATADLLEVARRGDHRATRAAADRVVAGSGDPDRRRRHAWRSRGVTFSADAATGVGRLSAFGPTEAIAAMAASIEHLATEVMAGRTPRAHQPDANGTGRVAWQQRRFDALASLLGCGHLLLAPDGEVPPATAAPDSRVAGGAGARVVIDLDLARFRHRQRRHHPGAGSSGSEAAGGSTAGPGETHSGASGAGPRCSSGDRSSGDGAGDSCFIEGIGPVPPAFAEALLADPSLGSVVQLVVRDGRDPRRIVNYSRHVPPELKAALIVRDGPCAVPACTASGRTHIDHNAVDHAAGAPTSMATCDHLCEGHHFDKTYRGHTLLGEPGDHVWTDGVGTVLCSDRADHRPVDQLRAEHVAKAERIHRQAAAHRS